MNVPLHHVPLGVLLALAAAAGCAAPHYGPPLHKTAFDGGDVLCDGSYYHFRAANGVEMLDLWVPPGPGPVRGVFINGNPGGIGGDDREFTRDPSFQDFAARHGFGLVGLHGFRSALAQDECAEIVAGALDDFASMGRHPELSNVPLISLGSPDGGTSALEPAGALPQRAVDPSDQRLTPRPREPRPPFGSTASAPDGPEMCVRRRTLFDPDDRVLLAYALTPEQERQFRWDDGRASAFWDLIDQAHDHIVLTSSDVGDGKVSARMTVRAARSRAGLYLCFDVTDDAWAAPEPGPQLYAQDAVDVLLDSRSVEQIWSGPLGRSFVNGGWSLSLTTVQLQARCGRLAVPGDVRYNRPDPYEFRYCTFPRSDLQTARGIVIDIGPVSTERKVQEWFIPWAEVGADGLAGEPATGRRLAFAVGYNDQDPGRHDGDAFDGLRWPPGDTPWDVSWLRGRNDTWGSLEMGPVLR